MKKIIIITILFAFFITGLFVFLNKNRDGQFAANETPRQEKIKIAACPTCFERAEKINTEKYKIIKTTSTAESLALLGRGQVDMILAGRTLKPGEPQMDNILIEEGYSFLSNQEAIVYIDQLNNYAIYTDLDIKLLKNIFPIQKIEQVSDVYEYLDKGIVITSWENTDYAKAATVHLLEESGERVKLSRRPTIYCPNICGKEAQELALLINSKQRSNY